VFLRAWLARRFTGEKWLRTGLDSNKSLWPSDFPWSFKMKRNSAVVLSLIMFLTLTVNAQERRPLKLIKTTPLPGFIGDFDHFAIDLRGKRLFLTAEDHKTVEVFDLDGNRIHSITGFGKHHAALFLHYAHQLIVTGGHDFEMAKLVD